MIQQTSLEAYKYVLKNLTDKQAKVYKALGNMGDYGACNHGLGLRLGWPINCVTPRNLELRKMNLVVGAGIRKVNGRNVHFWKVAAKPETLF